MKNDSRPLRDRLAWVLKAGALSAGVLALASPWAPWAAAQEDDGGGKTASKATTPVEKGKELAFDRKMGNCLACHMIPGGEAPGNIGPPLVGMKARFPDRAKLFAQIWDATKANPNTIMPPFGRHGVLTKAQVNDIVDFLYTQ